MKARVTEEIKSTSDKNKTLPVGAVGNVVWLYPQCVEIDFGIYGVWFVSEDSVLNDKIELFKELTNS